MILLVFGQFAGKLIKSVQKYGVYVNILAGINKGLDKKEIIQKYEALPIKNRDEILISGDEIRNIMHIPQGKIIGKIYTDLEDKILKRELINNKDEIVKYIMENNYV